MNTATVAPLTRRHFLGTAAALSPIVFPYVRRGGGADGQGDANQDTLKIGLVGCGGRGSGAAQQALTADDNTKLYAVADVLPEKAAASLKMLGDHFAGRVDVPEERQFIGLDGYRKVIECCDVIILASPPGFRPGHLAAAVDAGKHIFCEKPMAVDAAGCRVALEAIRKSEEKKLNVVAGFCWRRSASRQEAFQRMHDGKIGDVASILATYHTAPVKPMLDASERPRDMSDVEWQVRNWYNFSWLGGDSLVEQAVHSVDKLCWALKDVNPISAVATGGRQIPSGGGNIYDHFHVAYEYENNVICHLASRQIAGCYNENADIIRGTKGALIIGRGDMPYMEGEERWRFRGQEANMYQVEHDELFAAIRKGDKLNDGDWMLHSTMVALMGRMAAYTGKKVTWADFIKSDEDLAPEETLKWTDAFTPTPMPRPGRKA